MEPVFVLLYLLAGVCLGLAAGRVEPRRVNLFALGVLFYVSVTLIKAFNNL